MGDIADMMLDGTLCQVCGEVLDGGEPMGFPVMCAACKQDESDDAGVPPLYCEKCRGRGRVDDKYCRPCRGSGLHGFRPEDPEHLTAARRRAARRRHRWSRKARKRRA